MLKASVSLRSIQRTNQTIGKVLDQVERRGMEDALMKAATPMVKQARQNVSSETGALKKSIGKKGSTDAGKQSAKVEVGPRAKFQHKGRRPAKYAHLVEYGHQMVTPGGKRVGFVGPRPFMRTAFESTKGESRKVYAKEIGGAIHRQFQRAKRRGRV